jgi:hypothetical protein
VAEPHVARINEAIKDCLRACYDDPSPMDSLASRLMALRDDPAWKEVDVEMVELRAIQMLRLMVRRSPSGEFETLLPHNQADSCGSCRADDFTTESADEE